MSLFCALVAVVVVVGYFAQLGYAAVTQPNASPFKWCEQCKAYGPVQHQHEEI